MAIVYTPDIPEFDSRFHDMLALYAAYKICSSGASPDSVQSDHFLREYNIRLNDLWKYTQERNRKALNRRRDNSWWH